MPLTPGTRLGPYEIVAAIGAGGMGQVYRAHDSKLGRDVAIKLLPDAVAHDLDRLMRFEREAKTLAALNHPNIAQIYGLEESGPSTSSGQPGTRALVMELVEGRDLSEVIAGQRHSAPATGATGESAGRGANARGGPGASRALSISEALTIARQIADALDAAHSQGIIHRDLKPANVRVRADGIVKVLDFGLAKALDPPGAANAGAMNSPTMTSPAMTAQGIILGTAAYMSPEQARGKVVDKRADIWAFGCVVYEMLTGTRAFQGETLTDVLAAVVKNDPDWTALPPDTPLLVRSLLRRCLQKDPDRRLHDIADARIEIQEALAEPETPAVPVVAYRRARERAVWAAAVIGVGLAGSTTTCWLERAPAQTHVVTRFPNLLPEGQSFSGRTDGHRVAISPDGTKLVYVANEQLYLRFMDQLEAQPISGTNEDPMEPVFSPNGQEIAYFVPEGGRGFTAGVFIAKKIAVSGGTPVKLAELPRSPLGASWHDTRLVFGMNDDDAHGIQAVSTESGGVPHWLVSIDPRTARAVGPQLLDDGKHVVFTMLPGLNSGTTEGDIVIQLLDSGPRRVLAHGTDAHLLSSGQLAYVHDNTVIGVPFNPTQLDVDAAGRVPLVGAVSVVAGYGIGEFAISRNGTLVYVPTTALGPDARMLVWVDRKGQESPIQAAGPAGFGRPRLSPEGDGTELAVSSGGDIWIGNFTGETADRLTLRQLTFDATVESNPVWMPHRRIAYDASDASPIRIASKAVDGTGAVEAIGPVPAGFPETVSPDGKFFVYHTRANVSMLLPLSPPGPPHPLVPTTPALNAEISPGGEWIAYQAKSAGRFEIYVQPFPAMEVSRWPIISSTGGSFPLWSRNLGELFFISGAPDSMMMSVHIETTPTFTLGPPMRLFPAGGYVANVARNFDVARDGKHFLMIKSVGTAPSAGRSSFIVVSHWFDEVQAKMGIK